MDVSWPSLEIAIAELEQATVQPKFDYGSLVSHLRDLGKNLVNTSPEYKRERVAQFHDCAGKIPYAGDCDVGALVLESIADMIEDHEMQMWLYQEAGFRAKWCAESGTSGSECHARSVHFKRIHKKMNT